MKNLSQKLVALEITAVKVVGQKINQIQRNSVKAELLEALKTDLVDEGLDAVITKEGVIVRVENEVSNISIQLDVVIKNLDFDRDEAVSEYEKSVEAKAERERKAKAKREKAEADKKAKAK
jgi:hypothetical protein